MADPATTTTTPDAILAAFDRGSLDFLKLPIRAQAIAVTMGSMLSDGYSKAEIARYYGKSRPWVSKRLDELRAALERRA